MRSHILYVSVCAYTPLRALARPRVLLHRARGPTPSYSMPWLIFQLGLAFYCHGNWGCRIQGQRIGVHLGLAPVSSDCQPAPASEHQDMGSIFTWHGTEVACPLKKLPWVFSRAQLSENIHCRKAQKANTNTNCACKKCMHLEFR